jgi:hypothetical protein
VSEAVNRPADSGQFISLWELFPQIGEAERAHEDEAARYLVSSLDSDPTGMNYLRTRDESGIVLPLDMGARLHLLRQLSIFGSQGTLLDADDKPNDAAQPTFERFGFYASDIYPFLARNDVAVARPSDEDSEDRVFPDGRRIPSWILAYDRQDWLSRDRVGKILIASTSDAELWPPQYDDVFWKWDEGLSDAVARGSIAVTKVSRKQMLSHADVRAWCAQHGYVWPIAGPHAQPADMPSAAPSPEQQAPSVGLAPASSRDHASKLRRRERQISMIEEMADKLGYQRLQVPEHGKQEIHKLCHSQDPHLFSGNEETFKKIWADAVGAYRIRMADHDKYARRE